MSTIPTPSQDGTPFCLACPSRALWSIEPAYDPEGRLPLVASCTLHLGPLVDDCLEVWTRTTWHLEAEPGALWPEDIPSVEPILIMALAPPDTVPKDHTQPARHRYEQLVKTLVERATANAGAETTRRYALDSGASARNVRDVARLETRAIYGVGQQRHGALGQWTKAPARGRRHD